MGDSPAAPNPLRARRGGLVAEVVEHITQQIQGAQLIAGSKLLWDGTRGLTGL